ncbi:M4 family metallopeptidase [Hydrocarboniphaga sp.]|uniref:M4 family metallopeptidase n=1 Tax=Hydrocarboniphaga sp. TaxID=2033016 RepID=UPI003D1526BC
MSDRHTRRPLRRSPLLLALTAAGLAAAAQPAVAALDRTANSPAEALQLLTQNTAGALTHNELVGSAYASVHAIGKQVLTSDNSSAEPLSRAQQFLSNYGAVLGVKDALSELRQARISKDGHGGTHVHMDQYYRGLPVFGARVIVDMNSLGITGTNGVFVKNLDGLEITPKMSVADLRARAVTAASKLHPKAVLKVESSRLMVYASGLLRGVEGKNFLAYEVVVKGTPGTPVRERMILNANTGAVLNRINGIQSVLNREIYTPGQTTPDPLGLGLSIPLSPVLSEGSALAPTDIPLGVDDRTKASARSPRAPTDNLYLFAGGTYALYKNMFGREGYDDGAVKATDGVQRQKSVYLVNDQCPNAYWDGDATNYCPAFDADDVVSHEWSHAYTEYTHGLIYQGQSGALNESYSDIFGETYDLVNEIEGPLGASLTEGDYYENRGSRWVVGEDLSEALAIILLRDMWDPDSFPAANPGKTSSENYDCGEEVHTNSGVPNHGYAMLVDGKEYNGHTITGIGMTKAAHIYFQAETHHQTPTTNFAQHADALELSCSELIGVPLNDPSGAVSTDRITAADCASVHEMTEAVEFRRDSELATQCGFQPILKPEATTPALCAVGKFPTATSTERFDGATLPASWVQGKNVTGDTDIAPWTISTTLPAPHSGSAAFFANDTGGTCTTGGDQSAEHWIDTPETTLQDDASFFTFTHYVHTEAGFDGGNLKVKVGDGDFVIVPGEAFSYNGHSGAFTDAPLLPGVPDPVGLSGNNTSPLAGEAGWTGADQGKTTGSWGTTVVDLSKLAMAPKKGDKVVFRFDFGNDGCGGSDGWYVDDVSYGYCSATAPLNTLPIANLLAGVVSGVAPIEISFTVGGSDPDLGDKITGYSLDFGDGSPVAAATFAEGTNSVVLKHTYTAIGQYTAKLTVTDSNGGSSAASSQLIKATDASGGTGGSGGGGSGSGGGGGGALGGGLLLPLLGLAALRRRKRSR